MIDVPRDDAPPAAPALDLAAESADGRAQRSWGWRSQLPEPAHLWIRFRPAGGKGWRDWPGPERPWLDFAHGGPPVWTPGDGALPEPDGEPLGDVALVPPVAAEHTADRKALIERLASHGTPVLDQRLAPDTPSVSSSPLPEGVVVVYDLLAPLLGGDLETLARLPAGSTAVWPLLAGITDDPGLWREGCRKLAAAGVATLQAMSPPLGPADRRRLADGRDESVFEALFHRPAPEPRGLACEAWRHGLSPLLERPLPRPPLRGRGNRRVAGRLALIAELWHRLDRPAARGQDLFRAAREIDRTSWDLAALARDGNLGVLTWLRPADRKLVEEILAGERPGLLDELWNEYLS